MPRFQIDPNDNNNPSLVSLLDRESQNLVHNLVDPSGPVELADLFGPSDFPVQYAYDFTIDLTDDNIDNDQDGGIDEADEALTYNDPRRIQAELNNGVFNDYEPFPQPGEPDWPARVVTPQQKFNIWADVDSDGDGLRDAMWIPIGVEVFRGGVDRDADGRVGADEGGDGIDNDLDAYNQRYDGVDNNGDGLSTNPTKTDVNIDEPDETAVFVTGAATTA